MDFYYNSDAIDKTYLANFSVIEQILDDLDLDTYSFITVEAKPQLENVTFVQAMYIREKKGLFFKKTVDEYYQVEIQIAKLDGKLSIYAHCTKSLEEVKYVFKEYYVLQKVPDYSGWEHIMDL